MVYMQSGEIDLVAGHYLTDIRRKNWLVSEPLLSDDIRVIYNKGSLKVTSLTDLKGLRGSAPRGASYGRDIDEFIESTKKKNAFVETDYSPALFSLILTDRVDYAFISNIDAIEQIKRKKLQDIIEISASLHLNTIHISFSKNSACSTFYQDFEALLTEYKSNGTIDKLLNKYHVPTPQNSYAHK